MRELIAGSLLAILVFVILNIANVSHPVSLTWAVTLGVAVVVSQHNFVFWFIAGFVLSTVFVGWEVYSNPNLLWYQHLWHYSFMVMGLFAVSGGASYFFHHMEYRLNKARDNRKLVV